MSVVGVREGLQQLARNLAYGWRPEMRTPFKLLDSEGFDAHEHNPWSLLEDTPSARLQELEQDPDFQAALAAGLRALAEETSPPEPVEEGLLVAYFSSEFGVDESLPIYSGGLGVLAGDHLKSSSELGLPLVGVGLLYRQGYFRQSLDESGRQLERYPANHPTRLPLALEAGPDGGPLTVTVELSGEICHAYVWRADVGRTRLYLLDSDVPENNEWGRRVTDALYGGDREQRLRQELLLGVGGVRALRALGLEPTVFHMNEGHAAFLQFERLRELMTKGLSYEEALAALRQNTVFTTHTPVAAGNEVFDDELLLRYLGPMLARLGVGFDQALELGRVDSTFGFGLTPFALRTSAFKNGVSELHGEVSRQMWRQIGSDGESIGHITNGVHARTWLSSEMAALLRGQGLTPEAKPREQEWDAVFDVAAEELWQVHNLRKRLLVETAKRRFAGQPHGGECNLDPEALTIGFARRFATYKRAGLIFSDPDRLGRLLASSERPLQILFAGKAHPQDEGGKDLIRRVVEFTSDPRSQGRVVFLDDYEMTLARRLVQGVDVWLNNPRRPLEASGTSGMKAAMNGALNVSILDGWWAEGYSEDTGFAVGLGGVEDNEAVQDQQDADALFWVLEDLVLPLYYRRDEAGLPREWLSMMRNAISELGADFNTGRMVQEYLERYYLPAHRAR